jgi:predicted Fe-Mo cluster-binding NifX family protein
MKKVAIPTKNRRIDSHFGQAKLFRIYTLENGQILKSEELDSLEGCGCKSKLIQLLKERGVSVMLAGNMGGGAYQKLLAGGIEVIRGCSGEVDITIRSYLAGELKDDGSECHSHRHHGHHV